MKNKIFETEAMSILEEDGFGDVPMELKNKMQQISDLSRLKSLKDGIKQASNYDQVRKLV